MVHSSNVRICSHLTLHKAVLYARMGSHMKSYLYFVKRHVGDSETQRKRFSVLTRIKFTFSALAQSINFVQYNTTHHPDNTLKHGDGSIMCALHQQELGKWSGLRARWMKSNKGQYSGGDKKQKPTLFQTVRDLGLVQRCILPKLK